MKTKLIFLSAILGLGCTATYAYNMQQNFVNNTSTDVVVHAFNSRCMSQADMRVAAIPVMLSNRGDEHDYGLNADDDGSCHWESSYVDWEVDIGGSPVYISCESDTSASGMSCTSSAPNSVMVNKEGYSFSVMTAISPQKN